MDKALLEKLRNGARKHLWLMVVSIGFSAGILLMGFLLPAPRAPGTESITMAPRAVVRQNPPLQTQLPYATAPEFPTPAAPKNTLGLDEGAEKTPSFFPDMLAHPLDPLAWITQETLPLPAVDPNGLKISVEGAGNFAQYFAAVARAGDTATLTQSEYNSLMKDAQGVVLFPVALIDRALAAGDFSRIHESAALLKQIFIRNEALLRTIPVRVDGVSIAQKALGMNQLTVQLLDRALAREENNISAPGFQRFFQQYQNTQAVFRRAIDRERANISVALPIDEPRGLTGTMRVFARHFAGLLPLPEAWAQGPFVPFGGRFTQVTSKDCECTGLVATIQDVSVGVLDIVIPYTALAVGVYNNHNLTAGQNTLGLYFPTGICIYSGNYPCTSQKVKRGLWIMGGTS